MPIVKSGIASVLLAQKSADALGRLRSHEFLYLRLEVVHQLLLLLRQLGAGKLLQSIKGVLIFLLVNQALGLINQTLNLSCLGCSLLWGLRRRLGYRLGCLCCRRNSSLFGCSRGGRSFRCIRCRAFNNFWGFRRRRRRSFLVSAPAERDGNQTRNETSTCNFKFHILSFLRFLYKLRPQVIVGKPHRFHQKQHF